MWGISPSRLSTHLGDKRIENINLLKIIQRIFKKNSHHKSLIKSFLYPSTSIHQLCDSLEKKHLSNNIKKEVEVSSIVPIINNNFRLIVKNSEGNEKMFECKNIISTIPLHRLNSFLPATSSSIPIEEKLPYRSLIIIYLLINKSHVIDDHWIYFPGRQVFHRVFEPMNFHPEQFSNNTVIGVEIICNYNDHLWKKTDEEISKKVISELVGTNIIKKSDILDESIKKLKDVYPVYIKGFEKTRDSIISNMQNIGIYPCGRLGAFEYNSIEDSIISAFKAVKKLNEGNQL